MRAETRAVGRDIEFYHQRRERDREAAADRRHAMVVANLHIVEEYFVHMAVAARKLDRAHGDAWCLHAHHNIVEALVLREGRFGAHYDEAITAYFLPATHNFF